jgi:hypothetical protein
MKADIGGEFVSRTTIGAVSATDSVLLVPNRAISLSAVTRLLRMQQPSADRVEVSQRGGDLQAVEVLGEAAVTHLLAGC